MSGIHKKMGWNACGVYCGECCKDTCEGCEYEYKPFKGFSQETIDRLKKIIAEEEKEEQKMRNLIPKSAKLSWGSHKNHYELLKEFYLLKRDFITEQFKDALLDAIECMEYTMTEEGEKYDDR